MQQANFVRNRAAHHEPIHLRDLAKDMRTAQELVGWISPVAEAWVAATASLPAIIAEKP
jgi:hypothetical protein